MRGKSFDNGAMQMVLADRIPFKPAAGTVLGQRLQPGPRALPSNPSLLWAL